MVWTCQQVVGAALDVAEAAQLYRASTLADRRPVDDTDRFTRMLAGANLVMVARYDDRLIGIARCVTDGAYTTYVADLAVDAAFQGQGVGRALLRATQQAAPQASLVLLAAPAATDYYPHIGFTRHESAWTLATPLTP